MDQLQLAMDLTTITSEVKFYKQMAGQSIFEIGRRLKHVKEHDLAHGEFMPWVEGLGFSQRTANRMMQAVEQFGNWSTSSSLEPSKLFEMLSLPESIDRQEFVEVGKEDKEMKPIGIVRAIDDLGRVVIPKEIRTSLNIAPEDKVEIFATESQIILQKHGGSCVLCGGELHLVEYNERKICLRCVNDIHKLF